MLPSVVAIATAVALSAQYVRQEYHAKVVLSDGTPLRTTPSIVPEHYGFCRIGDIFGNGNLSYVVPSLPITSGEQTPDDCQVTIRLTGYKTQHVTLHDGLIVTLQRIGDSGDSTVSLTEMAAPDKAKRAFGKGLDAMTAKKWDAARQNFQKAVDLYPKYAAAWTGLGILLRQESKTDEARAMFEKAIDADPKYPKPYTELAMMAELEGKQSEVIAIADRAAKARVPESARLSYVCAAAQFQLGHMDAAEQAARRAVDLDSEHQLPRAELLLGKILAVKGDAPGAVRAWKDYLKHSPDAPDRAEVEQNIEKLEAGSTGK